MLGVDRTYSGHHDIDAFDPKRTSERRRRAVRAPKLSGGFPERFEARTKLFGEELRLFPGREVAAFRDLVVVCVGERSTGGARSTFE